MNKKEKERARRLFASGHNVKRVSKIMGLPESVVRRFAAEQFKKK